MRKGFVPGASFEIFGPDAVFYRHFRSAGGTSVISRAPRWKVT
jgi:hypothetical protein